MVMLLPAIGEMRRAAAGAPGAGAGHLACAGADRAERLSAAAPQTALALGLLIAQEVTAGILVGAMARIIMSALQVAGYLIATQTGLAYAQTVDPTQHEQGAVVGNFFSLLGAVLIFVDQPASSRDRRDRGQLPA